MTADRTIAICRDHGWWFDLPASAAVVCPEPGCRSPLDIYELTYEARPSDNAEDDDE